MFAQLDATSALLKRNPYSLISQEFPNSPKSILVKGIPLTGIDSALANREVDLVVRLYSGKSDRDWTKLGIERGSTTASGIININAAGKGERPAIGGDYASDWQVNRDPILASAETFLPFASAYSLKGAELLNELPEHSAKKIRMLCSDGYFTQAFLDQLRQAAQSVGTEIEFVMVPSKEWFASFEDPKAHEKGGLSARDLCRVRALPSGAASLPDWTVCHASH